MTRLFKRIFGVKKPIIGALHFIPMPGFEGFETKECILDAAKRDLFALESGGADAIIVENNYDLPHKIKVGHETVAMMALLTSELMKHSKLPFGISVLWNDYEAALTIAKATGAKFVRVPVFVDNVRTAFGDIYAEPLKIIEFRRKIKAEDIAIFTDIHVKHAEMLETKSLAISAKQALEAGSDGIIITGKWTGDAPKMDDLKEARKTVGNFSIIIGSGADKENVRHLLRIADGVIVSTALKEGMSGSKETERNIKPYSARIDINKIREFMDKVHDGKP